VPRNSRRAAQQHPQHPAGTGGVGSGTAVLLSAWLLWPAAQLRYAFAQAIDYSLATPPEPSVSVAPKR